MEEKRQNIIIILFLMILALLSMLGSKLLGEHKSNEISKDLRRQVQKTDSIEQAFCLGWKKGANRDMQILTKKLPDYGLELRKYLKKDSTEFISYHRIVQE